MRLAVIAAVCLSMVGLAVAADAHASIRMQTDIPAQGLGPALKTLAKDRGFQVVFRTEVVGNTRTRGAAGDLTTPEALTKLLEGTNLAYSYLDENTVTILPRAELGSGSATDRQSAPTSGDASQGGDNKEGQKRNSFRLAQVDSGASSGAASVAGANSSSEENAKGSVGLSEIIVTAQKKSERLQDVPIPVTVLNTQALTDNNRVLLRDYFSAVPGLSVTPNIQNAQIISLRGISTGDYTNPTVGITVDGVPYIGGVQPPDIDPGDLQRVEVLRGPQGTLYGASSMGGLIQYVTIDPTTAAFSGRAEGGTNYVYNGAEPGYNFRGSVNIPVTDTLAVRLSGFNRLDAGYIDNPFTRQDGINEAKTFGGRMAALWRPMEDLSLKVSALYQNTFGYAVSDAEVKPGLGDLQQDYLAGAGQYGRIVEAYSTELKYRFAGMELVSLTGYNVNKNKDSFDATPFYESLVPPPFSNSTGIVFYDHTNNTKLSEELRLSGSIASQLDWLLGGFFTREQHHLQQDYIAQSVTTGQSVLSLLRQLDPTGSKEQAGFATLTYHVTRDFDLQIGGRESHIDVNVYPGSTRGIIFGNSPNVDAPTAPESASFNSFTYLLTPSYKFTPDLMTYARFSSGYRPGGPNAPSAVAQGATPSFTPDKTHEYEVGVKGEFLDHSLVIDAAAYYIDWKNLQIQLDAGTFSYQSNGGAAKSQGIELSVISKPLRGLTVSGWFSFDDAVLKEAFPSNSQSFGVAGDRLPISSRYSGNLSLEQEVNLRDDLTGFAGATVTYIGNRMGMFTNSADRLEYPSYVKADLRAGVRHDAWTVNLYVNNAADKRGILSRIDFFPQEYVYIQPRTIGLNVAKSF